MRADFEYRHLLICNLDSRRVLSGIEHCSHSQPSPGSGRTDQFNHIS
jgi:hypothetical protein